MNATILERDRDTFTVAAFWEYYDLDKFDFNPPYQRKSVWSEEKQAFFIGIRSKL